MEFSEDLDEREKEIDGIFWDPKTTRDEIIQLYDTWNKTYDKDMLTWGYHLDKHIDEFENITGVEKDSRILDVAAGTGFAGEKLAERGYTNVDALDGSGGMLEKAREKGVYKNYIHALVTSDPIKEIENDSYDALICIGGLDTHHITQEYFEPLVGITKPGGYIYFVTVLEYLEPKRREFEDKMRQLEEDGIWSWILMKKTQDKYDADGPAVLFAFQVLKRKNKKSC